MKSDLQVKFLSYMTGRKKGEGFTLIELLVVIIIIGILAAIALPSFLNQANKAKQSEAKSYVGTVGRAEQAYYLENTIFTTSFDDLAKVVAADTPNYAYKMVGGNLKEAVQVNGITNNPVALRSYTAGVKVAVVGGKSVNGNDATTLSVLCETLNPSAAVGAPDPTAAAAPAGAQGVGGARCPGMKELGS
jgi:type IV pilus assembly protein PilA